jgi:hypothetical protein
MVKDEPETEQLGSSGTININPSGVRERIPYYPDKKVIYRTETPVFVV